MTVTDAATNYRYFDYAATAPLCEEAAAAMAPYLVPGVANLQVGGNANSLYTLGRDAFSAMEDARRSLARSLGARRPDEIVFTSGATEADDAAIIGLARAAVEQRQLKGRPCARPHIITTAIEHEAVLQPCKRLEREGYRITRLAPDRRGFVSVEALRAALDDDTVLVSVQMANSEVGSIQPIAEMAAAAHSFASDSARSGSGNALPGILFHTDATQALGKTPIDLQKLGVDAASFSGHKVGGPKGVGALYLKARTPFQPYLLGGGQEAGKRSGTQNVCGMVGFAAAAQAVVEALPAERARLVALRDELYRRLGDLRGVRPTVDVTPGDDSYLPNIVHVLVRGLESETLILRLDKLGFCVSGGSACASHSLDPSHVLTAMGVPADQARGALRLSMGRYTTADDVASLLETLPAATRR